MMARYFFNVIDGKFLVDDVGSELPDMAAVRAMAVQTAGAILHDEGRHLPAGSEWLMDVVNEARETVFKLRFSAQEVVPSAKPAVVAGVA